MHLTVGSYFLFSRSFLLPPHRNNRYAEFCVYRSFDYFHSFTKYVFMVDCTIYCPELLNTLGRMTLQFFPLEVEWISLPSGDGLAVAGGML